MSDSFKVRAAVIWIAENIQYDVKSWKKENANSTGLDYVLKNKKAICEGYAGLLKYFCDFFSIECRIVKGKARSFNSDILITESRLAEDHAWNLIKLNGKWEIIDPTWVSGYVTGDIDDPNSKFIKEFNDDYFFASPEKFILNHFPTQSQNQLLTPAVKADHFKKSPLYFTSFLKDSISDLSPDQALIKTSVGDTIVFRFKAKEGFLRMGAWSSIHEKGQYWTDVFVERGWMEFRYPVTTSGYYNLYVGYANGGKGKALVAYKLQVEPKKRRL